MPAGDVWGNSWGDSWGNSWALATGAPAVEVRYTGGLLSRHKTEKEKRLERIKMGIIPPDLPPAVQEDVEKAAISSQSASKARKLAKKHAQNREYIERIVSELHEAYTAIEREVWDDLLQESSQLSAERAAIELKNKRRRNSAAAAILVLNSWP